jgi:hypothetical protein
MKRNISRTTLAIIFLTIPCAGFAPLSARGAGLTLTVNCNTGQTIGAALARVAESGPLGANGPATILVSGTCNEDVSILRMDHLTLPGNPTATINGGSDPNAVTLGIHDSRDVTVNDITIARSGLGVNVERQSLARFNGVTIQNSQGDGLFCNLESTVQINNSTVQNNADIGVEVHGGTLILTGTTIQGNTNGGVLAISSRVTTSTQLDDQGFPLGGQPTTIQNNSTGIIANVGSSLFLFPVVISGNSGDGVQIQGNSSADFRAAAVTGNQGHGVRIGDVSFVRFRGQTNVSGNNTSASSPLDVVCDPRFSTTRGIGTLTGATTNCPAELPVTP